MNRITVAAMFFLTIFSNVLPYSLPKNQGLYADRCITMILNGNYETVFSIADSAIAADNDDPLAPILKLTAIGIRDIDFDLLMDSTFFFNTYALAVSRVNAYEKTYGQSSYSRMLTGFYKAMHSSYFLRLESYYRAMQNGFSALDCSKYAAELDASNGDALFFLGLYDYARGELKKRLWWIMFWYPGSKDQGIKKLWMCNKQGILTHEAALFVLSDIYSREGMAAECRPILNELEKRFPASRFVLWEKAKYFECRKLPYEAALTYDLIAESYSLCKEGAYNELIARNLQARMLYQAGQKSDALSICQIILKKPPSKRTKTIYRDTEKLMEKINGR